MVVVRRKAGDEKVDWAQVFEEKQRPEEVQQKGKGGTAIILSALRAVTDLSGPLVCPVIQDSALWHATDLYQCGKRLQSPCVHVWLHGCLFGLCVVSAAKAIKWAEPCVHNYAVCMEGV